MLLGVKPFGALPISGFPLSLSKAVASPFSRLLAEKDPSLLFLVVVKPYDPDLVVPYTAGLRGPMGSAPLGSVPRQRKLGGRTVLYLSDKGYQTTPSDASLPNINFMPRLSSAYNMQLKLFNGGEPTGRSVPGFGSIVIRNEDGGLNDWHHYLWDGAEVTVLCGTKGFAFSEFGTVLSGRVMEMTHTETQIELALWDRQVLFQKPIYTGTYAGTGGLEGGADLLGKDKPFAVGIRRAVEPVLVDTTNLVYQFHAGSMEAVDRLTDGGLALTSDGNVADVYEWAPVAGHYVTCLAKGIIRLGVKPTFALQGDIRGDNTGGYVDRTGAIIKRIATTWMFPADRLHDPEDFQSGTFGDLDALYPFPVGYYTTDATPVGQIIDDLMGGLTGWWSFTRDGRMTVGALSVPTVTEDTLTDRDIVQEQMRLETTLPPAWRRKLNYKTIGRALQDNEIAGSTSDEDRAFLKQASRSLVGTAETPGHSLARDEVTDTFLDDATNAQTFLSTLTRLFKDEHRVYSLPVKRALFKYFLGSKLMVQLSSNSYLRNRKGIVVGITEDAVTEDTVLELWI